MKRSSVIIMGLLVVGLTALGCASSGQSGAGWTTLIDGTQGLDNWNRVGDANWRAEDGAIVAEGSAAHVFFDPLENTVQQRPDWFLPTVAELEGRPEASFSPEDS